MSTIDDLLNRPPQTTFSPDVRWLKDCLDAGEKLTVELCKPTTSIGSAMVTLFVLRTKGGETQKPDKFEWDDELNSALVNFGVRAIDLKNEGERFALILKSGLRKVERRYGDGYLNAVFIDLLDESEISKNPEIAEVRKHVHAIPPEKMSNNYWDCRNSIANEIAARAVELRDMLKYGEEELKAIMTNAIALYLDERFSVSRRRTLGWL